MFIKNNSKQNPITQLPNYSITSFGFTLIELLITVTIIILLTWMSLASYNQFTEEKKLQSTTKKVIDVLELAKKKALSGDLYDINCSSFDGYAVDVSANSYQLKFCCQGSCDKPIQSYDLPVNITFTSDATTVQFRPLNIGMENTECLKIANNLLPNKCHYIKIAKPGLIEEEKCNSTCDSCSCP